MPHTVWKREQEPSSCWDKRSCQPARAMSVKKRGRAWRVSETRHRGKVKVRAN